MAKGGDKSCYTFECVADRREIARILNDFLSVNKFVFMEKEGLKYFQYSDPIAGKRFFEYYFKGNMLYIYAYIHNTKKPWPLDDSYAGSIPKQAYRNMLEPLIAEINRVNENARFNMQYKAYNQNGQYSNNAQCMNNGQYLNNAQYMNNGQYPNNAQYQSSAPYHNTFADVNNQSKEKQAIWGFAFAVFGVLMSFFGITWGAFVIFVEVYFAIQGLHTSKKIFSIITFILAALSLIIWVLNVANIISLFNY